MPYSIVRQRVENYAKWRRAFDEHAEAREAAGSRGGHLFRSVDDPAEVVVFLAWNDLNRARAYLEGAPEVSAEAEAGEVSERGVVLLEELGRPGR